MRKRGRTHLILGLFIIFVLLGTVFYHFVENWSWVDSFYFSGMTLTTVGYGDFTPTSPVSKIFTVVYVIAGLGIFLELVTSIFKKRFHKHFAKNKKLS